MADGRRMDKSGNADIQIAVLRARLADLEIAAGRLQSAAAGMALLADLPVLRAAARDGDGEALAAGLAVLAAAAVRVCDAAHGLALGTALLDRETRLLLGCSDRNRDIRGA